MINVSTSHARTLRAMVGIDPSFAGSIHDDESAGTFGFKGALVPGPTLCSYMSHLFVEAWGERWLQHGTMTQSSRRPVYEGDTLTATAEPVVADADGLRVAVVLRNGQGEDVASATGGLPNANAAPPDLNLFPHRGHLPEAPYVAPGSHQPGDPYYSTPVVYTDTLHDEYLAKVSETLDIFSKGRVAHPGYLLSLSMREAIASYTKPTPGVHVNMSAQYFNLARVGDTLSTSGQITRVFEKKGNHYADSDQLVIANGVTPIVLFRRSAIYALRTATQ